MTNDLHAPAEFAPDTRVEPGLTATVRGILDDAVELLKQQLTMFKAEIRSDIHSMIAAVTPIGIGIAPLLLGGLMLCFALVHFLHWATTPAGATLDVATLPLWACYAIVAAAFLLVGGILLGVGIYRLKTLRPLAAESTKALEENIQWLMNRNPK